MLSERWPVLATRVALKVAWERGDLTYLNRAQHWNREDRAFGATAALFPQFSIDGDRALAAESLIQAYFARYGPASIRDAVWWSGLSQARVRSALARAGRPLAVLATQWSTNPLYMFADSSIAHDDDGNPHLKIDFLAHEDVALKAYFETRARYLDRWPQRCVFNQIGEVLPTSDYPGRWPSHRMLGVEPP